MRIGYIIPSWPEQTHAFFWRELSALRSLGNEVRLFSTTRPERSACRHEFAEEAHRTTHYLFPPRLKEMAWILARSPERTVRAISYITRLRETTWRDRTRLVGLLGCAADLVAHAEEHDLQHLHGHSCADLAHVLALAGLLGGPGYSLTLHGDLPVYGTDHAAKTKRARFVTAVTRPLQEQLLAATSLDRNRSPVLTMGVDTDHFRPLNEAPAEAPKARPFRLVTVARLNPMKGHAHVIEAVHRLRSEGHDVIYQIAGEGPHRKSIEEKVQECDLKTSIEMLGSLGESEVLALLQNADAFVLASEGLGEAAPVSVMEAMSTGLPVIVSKIGGTTDMIEDGIDGILIDQGDLTGITNALRRLIADRTFRQVIAEGARRRAIQQFDYRVLAKELHGYIETFRDAPTGNRN